MIFWSRVIVGVLRTPRPGASQPRPLRARPRLSPQPRDTACQIKSKLLQIRPQTFTACGTLRFVASDGRTVPAAGWGVLGPRSAQTTLHYADHVLDAVRG